MEMVEASMERKTVWLCGACGRTGKTRMAVGDESCYLNSVEVYEDSIERDANPECSESKEREKHDPEGMGYLS